MRRANHQRLDASDFTYNQHNRLTHRIHHELANSLSDTRAAGRLSYGHTTPTWCVQAWRLCTTTTARPAPPDTSPLTCRPNIDPTPHRLCSLAPTSEHTTGARLDHHIKITVATNHCGAWAQSRWLRHGPRNSCTSSVRRPHHENNNMPRGNYMNTRCRARLLQFAGINGEPEGH